MSAPPSRAHSERRLASGTMRSRRFSTLSLAMILLGLAVAAAWVYWQNGASAFSLIADVEPVRALALLGITAVFVAARFFRWQYLLRHARVPVPTRDSLRIYLASLPGTATPAYVGEVVRCVLLRRRFGVPLRSTLPCLVWERLLDVGILAAIGIATAGAIWATGILVAMGLGAGLLAAILIRVTERTDTPIDLRGLVEPAALFQSALLSLAVWLPVTLGPALAARALGFELAFLDAMHLYASSTLIGALTLMPAGLGITGSALIVGLEGAGLGMASAIATVTLFRALTTGACLGIGSLFLMREWPRLSTAADAEEPEHFDAIAQEYGAQFRPHVWNLLLERRIRRLTAPLPSAAEAGIGLDLGCGLGLQAKAMRERGYRVIGVDPAFELLQQGRSDGVPTAVGSALELPFADGSLDFVYSVGVLHHILSREGQEQACREVARVLKPGGVFVVQETNTLNPLFRFYMGYVFPILSRIDEGTELWLEPLRWQTVPGFEPGETDYFTFLPDFIPRPLMPPFLALERRLEESRLQRYSVHYQAAMRRSTS